MLKKYIAREPEVDLVHRNNKDDTTIADLPRYLPRAGEVPDLEGYHEKGRGSRCQKR